MIGNIFVALLIIYLSAVFLMTVWERFKNWKAAREGSEDIEPPEEDETSDDPPEPDERPGKYIPGDLERWESEYIVLEQLYNAILEELEAGGLRPSRKTTLLSKLATTESRLNALARKMELAEIEKNG